MTWPRLLMCWIPEGWESPFGSALPGSLELVCVDRVHGFGLFMLPSVPFG
ncbi:MAG TPA: hypothetical protein VMA77_28325 [Solirubrobacteraceae bacterium]|nr:hypothetical protein [Solirubrobacteraceae bacterium]